MFIKIYMTLLIIYIITSLIILTLCAIGIMKSTPIIFTPELICFMLVSWTLLIILAIREST